VLFSTPDCRAVVIDLSEGDMLGDHSVHERAVAGEVVVTAGGGATNCSPGTLLTFAPSERRAARVAGGDACRASPARIPQDMDLAERCASSRWRGAESNRRHRDFQMPRAISAGIG
jgi:hypothetical protein